MLAIQLAAAPAVVLLDEPTRGLDYPAKARLRELVRALAADGRAVVLATHDVEFVAAAADRVVVMAEGEVVADGRTADVLVASPGVRAAGGQGAGAAAVADRRPGGARARRGCGA